MTIMKLPLLLILALAGCSTVAVANAERSTASLHDLVKRTIEDSSLRDDMKRGCGASLEDQYGDQIEAAYGSSKNQRSFNAVFFLGSEYVSMSSIVLEKKRQSLVVIYRDMDGQHATRSIEQPELVRISGLIQSAARGDQLNLDAHLSRELHDSCVVFISNDAEQKSASVVAASALDDSSTPAGEASALLQSMVE